MKKTTTKIHYYRSGNAFFYSTLSLALCFLLFNFPQPSLAEIATSGDVDPADPSTWTSDTTSYIGKSGDGTLDIDAGSGVSSRSSNIGDESGSTGAVTVDGNGSTWMNDRSLYVGNDGNGTLDVTSGGTVISGSNDRRDYSSYIGAHSDSTGAVTVDGTGSTWTHGGNLYVGYFGTGTLEITSGGLVSVGEKLFIDQYLNGDSYINMATGGRLALYGDGNESLGDFLGMIDGTDEHNYRSEFFHTSDCRHTRLGFGCAFELGKAAR